MARLVICPTCGERHLYSTSNAFRPFCSERCKLVDLGAWAEERYRIPVAAPLDPDFDYQQLDPDQLGRN